MSFRIALFAGAAAISLLGCGSDSNETSSSTSGTSVTSSASATGTSPFDKPFKLSNASALDVDGWLTSLGYDGEKPYGSVMFDENLGATVIKDIKIDEGDGNVITIAKAELYGIDEEAIARVKDGVAAIDSPFETVLQKVRLYDLNLEVDNATANITIDESGEETEVSPDSDDKITMSIGGLEFDTLKVRQGGIDQSAGENTIPAQLFNVFDLGGLYFKDYKFNLDQEEIGVIKFAFPDVRVIGLGGGKLKSLVANNFDYSFKFSDNVLDEALKDAGPQAGFLTEGPLAAMLGLEGQRIVAKSMVWNGIDASKLLQFGLKGEMPPLSEKNLLSLGKGEILDFDQYVGDKKLLTAKSSTFEMDKFTWLIPNVIRATSKDVTYDFTAYIPDGEDELLGIMNKHNLNNVEGDFEYAWNYDDKKGTANFFYDVSTDKLADIKFNLDASDAVFDTIAKLVESEDQAGLANVGKFNGMSLVLKDKKLLDMVYDIAALQMGGTGDDLRASTPALLRLSGGQVSALNPRISGYVDAAAEFLGKGGTLEISAKPAEPIPFAQLGAVGQTAPQTLPDVLELTVTHK